jgi:DNA-binding MarR family transcriptional regulator
MTAGQARTGQGQQPCGPAPEPDGPGQQRAAQAVMTLLRLCRALERVSGELTPQQYRILKLAGAGGERSARLAARLAVARPTLTAIADGLVAAGYARRDAEPGDRRVVRLCLTPSGRAAVSRADDAYARWLDQVLAQAGHSDQILHALELLDRAMDGVWSSGSSARAHPAVRAAGPDPDPRLQPDPRPQPASAGLA